MSFRDEVIKKIEFELDEVAKALVEEDSEGSEFFSKNSAEIAEQTVDTWLKIVDDLGYVIVPKSDGRLKYFEDPHGAR